METQDFNLILDTLRSSSARSKDEILGEFLHMALFFLDSYTGDIGDLIKAVRSAKAYYPDAIRLTEQDVQEVEHILINAMSNEYIGKLFTPDVKNLREVEFLDDEGNTIRVDRLNIDNGKNINVLEFKLKRPESQSLTDRYIEQLNHYMKTVKKVFQCAVSGIIIYFLQGQYEEVIFQ